MSWQRTEQPGHGEGRGVGAAWQRGYPSGHVGRAYLNGDWTLRDARGYLVARGRRMAQPAFCREHTRFLRASQNWDMIAA